MHRHYWEGVWNKANIVITTFLSFIWGLIGEYVIDNQSFLTFAIVVVIADMITGIMAAMRNNEELMSRGISRTLEKIALYTGSILIVAHFEDTFSVPLLQLPYVVAAIIAITEMKSFFENVEKITGTPMWSPVQQRINMVFGKFFKSKKDKS